MSATEAKPLVPEGIRESHGTAAQAGALLESAKTIAVSATEKWAYEVKTRLTKITLILTGGGPMANIKVTREKRGECSDLSANGQRISCLASGTV